MFLVVAGFWVWWPAFGGLGCYGFAGFVVGTWWVLFWVFGSNFRRLGQIWVAFGWLDLGPVVVIFSDGLGDLFRWV